MPIAASSGLLTSRAAGAGSAGHSSGEELLGSGSNSGNNSSSKINGIISNNEPPSSEYNISTMWSDLFARVILAFSFLVLYLVYAMSLFPGVAGGDSGELLAVACSGSVARKLTPL
jgi:hypothetical protein